MNRYFRIALVLLVGSIAYHALIFRISRTDWFESVNIILFYLLFSAIVPFIFGYGTALLLHAKKNNFLWIVVFIPIIANCYEFIVLSLSANVDPLEKAGLILAFWLFQILFVLTGGITYGKISSPRP